MKSQLYKQLLKMKLVNPIGKVDYYNISQSVYLFSKSLGSEITKLNYNFSNSNDVAVRPGPNAIAIILVPD